MEEFRATFRIGEKEAVDFYIYQAIRTRFVGVVSFGLLGLVICYIYGGVIIDSPVLLGGAMALSFALAALFTVVGMYLSVKIKVKKGMKQNNTADYDQHILINGYGVRTEANDKEVRISFDKIKAVRETGKAFYIYLSKDHAWILPKAQMEDMEKNSENLRKIFDMVIPSKQLHFKK